MTRINPHHCRVQHVNEAGHNARFRLVPSRYLWVFVWGEKRYRDQISSDQRTRWPSEALRNVDFISKSIVYPLSHRKQSKAED